MKRLITILLLALALTSHSQCVSNETVVISPGGTYSPGQTITVWYTLGAYNAINTNWIHAFQINLGVGWINLTPLSGPANPSGSLGNWTWDLQHTFIGGLNFGPGWRFENTGNTDWGTSSVGPFIMSFQVTVGPTCTPDDLSISMEVFDDCTTGGWSNGACCVDPPFQIYNGNVLPDLISTSLIYHY
jgi:hypothetical protein|tara:strand:+ start:3793 stop:4353 length:561 start_codon:yes stop_codon:yes gene_type:complete